MTQVHSAAVFHFHKVEQEKLQANKEQEEKVQWDKLEQEKLEWDKAQQDKLQWDKAQQERWIETSYSRRLLRRKSFVQSFILRPSVLWRPYSKTPTTSVHLSAAQEG